MARLAYITSTNRRFHCCSLGCYITSANRKFHCCGQGCLYHQRKQEIPLVARVAYTVYIYIAVARVAYTVYILLWPGLRIQYIYCCGQGCVYHQRKQEIPLVARVAYTVYIYIYCCGQGCVYIYISPAQIDKQIATTKKRGV